MYETLCRESSVLPKTQWPAIHCSLVYPSPNAPIALIQMPRFIHFENLSSVFDKFNWNIYSNTTWTYRQESFGWFLALLPWRVSIVASINDKWLMSGRSRIIGIQLPQMQSWQYVTAELEWESFILIVIHKCIELPQWQFESHHHNHPF